MTSRGPESGRLVAYHAVRAMITGDVATVERIYASTVVLHDSLSQSDRGLVAVRERALLFAGALWDATVSLHFCVSGDGLVTAHWSAQGTHAGVLLGVAPTMRPAVVNGVSVLRVEKGRVVEQWNEYLDFHPSRHRAPVMTALA